MPDLHRLQRNDGRRIAILVASVFVFAGCFQAPSAAPEASPEPSRELAQRVKSALADRPDDALLYAGFYTVLADRFEARAYATTAEAAVVAGRTADILGAPGLLKEIVNNELNPLIGKPQPLTPQLAASAAAKLRELSQACRRAAL